MKGYQLSIRQKIIFGYIVGVIVIAGISVFAITELLFIEKKVTFGGVVTEFFDTTLEIRRFEKNFFLYGKTEDYNENIRHVLKAGKILDNNINEYRRLAVSGKLDLLREDLNKYHLLMEQFAGMGADADSRQSALVENAIREKGKEIITIAEDISEIERRNLQQLLATMQKTLIVSLIIISILGIVFVQILSKRVVKPLKTLEENMNEISEGKLKTVTIQSREREIVSLTNAFNKMLKELELRQRHLVQREKLASLGTLISGVAHELNNPLSNISTSSQILAEEIEESDLEFKKDLLSQIEEQTDRAKHIVRSLLDFSRDKAFKQEVLPLKNLFEETIQFLRGEIPSKVSIRLQVQEGLAIFGDKQRIQQAFLNLVKNAVESIPEEGEVSIRASRHSLAGPIDERCQHQQFRGECTGECPIKTDTVDIEIQDTGEGIPPENLPKVFDPFFTTKDVGKGSGLGLYLVHEIIQEHGGCIGVDSKPGEGTIFLIRFPIKE
ncbi:MAG: ATP-binding protein [Nitrospirota bacterium]